MNDRCTCSHLWSDHAVSCYSEGCPCNGRPVTAEGPYQPCCADTLGTPVPCQHPPFHPAADTALRETASLLVYHTDSLAHWDETNGYAVNSERDAMAGDVSAAWDALRTALKKPTP